MTRLGGWGRFPMVDTRLTTPQDTAAVAALLPTGGGVARGAGRAYGDAAVGSGWTADMRALNRMIAFDPETGQLVAEAGVTLSDVIDTFLPRGWFPLVTPGTRHVTLGGMAAADVHGKNHHRIGSFRASVDWMDVMGPDGTVRRCSPLNDARLFDWSLGGMGLTGVILRLALRLRRVQTGWIRQTTRSLPDLAATLSAFDEADSATYSVAWIDCLARGRALGRSVLMLGEHAMLDELGPKERRHAFGRPDYRPMRLSVDLPSGWLRGGPMRAFNSLYFHLQTRTAARQGHDRLVGWRGFFYPLDIVEQWNRVYGRRGFLQFQCVFPADRSAPGLEAVLTRVAASGQGSFLAVLKRLGRAAGGISFAMDGFTLALDFPVSNRNLALLAALDDVVLDHGGRFYLAKDARMPADILRRTDPRTDDFRRFRESSGCVPAFTSALSERLKL